MLDAGLIDPTDRHEVYSIEAGDRGRWWMNVFGGWTRVLDTAATRVTIGEPLSGSITLQSLAAGDVLDGAQTDRLGLTLSMPIFRGGALRQNIRVQNALDETQLRIEELQGNLRLLDDRTSLAIGTPSYVRSSRIRWARMSWPSSSRRASPSLMVVSISRSS